MTNAKGTFRIASWDEQKAEGPAEPRLMRVRATMAYQGVIAGEGVVEFVMYSPDGQVTTFVGLERLAGSIGGRTGTAVFQHSGTFSDGVARSQWVVVPGSGTDGLLGLGGAGSYGDEPADQEHGGQAPLSFTFGYEQDA